MKRVVVRSVLVALTTIALGACGSGIEYKPHRVQQHSDVGDVHISATLVAPWENYVAELSPGFELSSAQALLEVLPTTSISDEKVVDTLAAALEFAPPTSAVTSTKTTSATDGAETTARERTSTTEPGDLSQAEPPKAPSPTLSTNLQLPKGKEPGQDPFLKYTAANALYQEVKLLNNYVRDAAQRHNATPYVMRLQVTLAPFARNQPYDTHMTVSFVGRDIHSEWECREHRSVYVVPLLVTDNLEAQLSARSSTVVRQLSAAATVLQGGFAAALGLDSRLEKLNAILANDLNSLLTVGRATRNSLYVRLGAMQAATAQYAMVPRNYNITVMVLVEQPRGFKAGCKPKDAVRQEVRVASTVAFRDVDTGKPLPRDDGYDRVQMVKEMVEAFQTQPNAISDMFAEELLLKIFVNEPAEFIDLLRGQGKYGTDLKIPELNEADLWNAIVERLGRSGYVGDNVELPKRLEPEYPALQTVLLLDDGVNRTLAQLVGGRGLDPDALTATLTLPVAGGGSKTLAANEVSVGRGGSHPVVSFPSFSAWGIEPALVSPGRTAVNGARLELGVMEQDGYENDLRYPSTTASALTDVHYRKLGAKKPAYLRLSKSAAAIKPDKDAKGTLRVHIEFLTPGGNPKAQQAELVMEGADLVKATDASGNQLTPQIGKLTLANNTTLTLNLENLIVGTKLTIDATAKTGGKPVGAKLPALEIPVK